jgi:hypothetical protein
MANVLLVTRITIVTNVHSTPLGSHDRHGSSRACPDHRSRTPSHKVVTVVTIAEVNRTIPD